MATIEYEKTECGRCGGGGRYSYNHLHGDVCYGCGGSGQKLTKRGAAAKAFADSLLDIRIEEFTKVEGRRAIYRDWLTGRRTRFSKAVRKDEVTVWTIGKDGERRPSYSYEMICVIDGVETPTNYSLGEGIRVRMIPTEQDVAAITEYQNNLTKAGKPRKAKG